MEKLPHLPKSQKSFRKPSAMSPSSYRTLKKALVTRNTSKFINLSGTLRNKSVVNQDEIPEISFQLTTLRKNLDKYSVSNFYKENRLRELKFKLKEMNDSQMVKPEETQMKSDYKAIKAQIREIELSMVEELEDQRILENIQDRMQVTKAFHEKREKKLKKKLEVWSHNLNTQTKLRKETVDSVNQYRVIYKSAFQQVELETKELETEICRMENQSVLKKKMLEKTEEHNKHRLEIVELTMIDERSSHLDEIRNSKLLHFGFDHLFLRKKLEKEKHVFNRLNDAFLKVKIQTGLHDIDDVIERFLTQESNYRELIGNLQVKEKRVDEFKEKIQDVQARVDGLNEIKGNFGLGTDVQKIAQEVNRLKEKKKELVGVKLIMDIWIENIAKKMGISSEYPDSSILKDKYARFGQEVLKMIRAYAELGTTEKNEHKRKRVNVEEIVQAYLAKNGFRVKKRQSVLEKTLRSIHKTK